MADDSALPDLIKRLPASSPVVATLKLFGKGESEVAQRLEGIEDLVPEGMRLVVQYRATFPEIHLRLVIEGNDRSAATSVLKCLVEDARRRLGRHVFAAGGAQLNTDFPAFVGATLNDAGMTLAAAEVASSGAVARMLGASEQGMKCLRGSLVAADVEVLKRQLKLTDVSAEEAADKVGRQFGADVGIATFGSADGSGGTQPGQLTVAAVGPNGMRSRELYFPIDRDRFQRLAAYAALKLAVRVVEPGT